MKGAFSSFLSPFEITHMHVGTLDSDELCSCICFLHHTINIAITEVVYILREYAMTDKGNVMHIIRYIECSRFWGLQNASQGTIN